MNKINFENLPSTNTPINATNLNQLQTNVENTLNTYSTSEIRIGTWIDGKPLYRKVIDMGALPNNTSKSLDTGLIFNSSNCILRNISAVASYANGITFPLPFTSLNDFDYMVSINIDNNNKLVVTTGQDRSGMTGYAILQYTKATD